MIVSFDWWLLVVGIVGGAGLVWIVIADFRRRDDDIAADEQADEATWIATTVTDAGRPVDDATVGEVLRLHRAYLASPVPDLDPVGQEPEVDDADLSEPGVAEDRQPAEGEAVPPDRVRQAGTARPEESGRPDLG